MITNSTSGISYWQFPHLSNFKGLWHGIFLRRGGHSRNAYRSLNLSMGVGDDSRHVARNRAKVAAIVPGQRLVYTRQTHGCQVFMRRAQDGPSDTMGNPKPPQADALISDVVGDMLVIQVADCQAVLLYDPQKRVVANVHSGWRGSVQNVIGATVLAMQDRFGCQPGDMLAGIGPSLGPCCSEFIHFRQEIPSRFWSYRDHRDHFDFWAISHDQLQEAGLASQNIHNSRVCTKCTPQQFFSYRGEQTTGRFGAVIGLCN